MRRNETGIQKEIGEEKKRANFMVQQSNTKRLSEKKKISTERKTTQMIVMCDRYFDVVHKL